MDNTQTLASINEKLDEVLMKRIELTQDYVNVTVECESHQKNGFLNLAKARYIQGSQTVSKNCLYSEETEDERLALVTVTREMAKLDLECENKQITPVEYEQPALQISTDSAIERQLNNQFGMLSSNTLKLAKQEFRKCLEKSMERVTVMEQMTALQKLHKELLQEKVRLQESVAQA